MKTIFKSFSMLAVAACAGMSIASCTAEKDLYNPEVVDQDVKAEYAANFVKKYGAVAVSQGWDFSKGSVFSLPAKSTRAVPGEYNPIIEHGVHANGSTDYYYVQDATLDYLNANLKEQTDNSSKGTSFFLQMPGNKFTIMPIYIGEADLDWTLHLVSQNPETGETDDMVVWSKGQDVEVSSTEGPEGTWTKLGTKKADNTMTKDGQAKKYVRTKAHTVSGMPTGTVMWFYLHTSQNKDMSSMNEQMIALTDMAAPSNLPDCYDKDGNLKERKVMIVGCEDLDIHKDQLCDKDMNDVVFLIYGDPDIPEEERPVVIRETAEKRYMIEDLGSTDDFDFNDIVIDVTAVRTVTKYYVGETPVEEHTQYGPWEATATLRHLGGILPFTVKVGDTSLSWEPNIDENGVVRGDAEGEVVEVTGWDPELNNVTVTVQGRNNKTYYTTFNFPKEGEVPMIIATDFSEMWMNERVSIEKRW